MRKDTMLVVFGIIIILVPFAGIPAEWKTAIIALLGLFVVFVSLSLRHYLTRVSEHLSRTAHESRAGGVFVEHAPEPMIATTVMPLSRPHKIMRIKHGMLSKSADIPTAYAQSLETTRRGQRRAVVAS